MLQPPRHACSSFYFVTTKSYLQCSCRSSIRWLICPATIGHNVSNRGLSGGAEISPTISAPMMAPDVIQLPGDWKYQRNPSVTPSRWLPRCTPRTSGASWPWCRCSVYPAPAWYLETLCRRAAAASREPSLYLPRHIRQARQSGDFKAARRETRGSGTCVSNDLLPRLIGDNVEQQRGDEGCEGPQPHGAVSAAAGHGEGTTLVAG